MSLVGWVLRGENLVQVGREGHNEVCDVEVHSCYGALYVIVGGACPYGN